MLNAGAIPHSGNERRTAQQLNLPVHHDTTRVTLGDRPTLHVVLSDRGDAHLHVTWLGEPRAEARLTRTDDALTLVGLQTHPGHHQQDLDELVRALEPVVSAERLDVALALQLNTPVIGSDSPWGPVDIVDEVEPGIWLVHTARHGGYFLGLTALALLPPPARTSDGWYEEHLDAMVPAVFLGWANRLGKGEVTRAIVRQHRPDLRPYL